MENKTLGAAILALGVAVGGFFPGYYYYQTHATQRSVVVKGLAEKNVQADLAIWTIKIVVNDNDLQVAQKKIERQMQEIRDFIQKQGFAAESINAGAIETNDLLANPYRNSNENNASRFILNQTVTVRTDKVDLVAASLSKTNELLGKGIVMENQSASYFFTKLNDIKPEMLKQATENARHAALEFAQNSGSKVGKIRSANQGVFSIQSRDDPNAYEPLQIDKKVRVVSTIDYFLED